MSDGTIHALNAEIARLRAINAELVAALEEMLRAHSMQEIGINSSMARAEAKKAARAWFADSDSISGTTFSKSNARKAASATIAKIPLPLARWVARVYRPVNV